MDSVNIKILAEKLDLSTSTISRAFRGNSDISKSTKDRILALAKELDYIPNHHASNLREQKSRTIAVIVPEIANNFFSQNIKGIEQVCRRNGYHILINVTNDDYEKEVAFINDLHNGRVDGIIMSVSGEEENHGYLNNRKKKIPLVFFDRVYEDVDTPKVTTNDYHSSFEATEHLIQAGCREIAYLVRNKSLSIGKTRMQGYVDALKQYNIPFRDELVIDCTNDQQTNQQIIREAYLSLKPDGIFASVERLAIATYYIAQDLSIRIPEQLKVISFSSLEIAPLLNPSLTTITQPAFRMGVEAANLLFEMMHDCGTTAVKNVQLESDLIPRRSTGF